MFVSWMTAAKVEGGISSIHDVTKKEYYHSDNMESFMFAETFNSVLISIQTRSKADKQVPLFVAE